MCFAQRLHISHMPPTFYETCFTIYVFYILSSLYVKMIFISVIIILSIKRFLHMEISIMFLYLSHTFSDCQRKGHPQVIIIDGLRMSSQIPISYFVAYNFNTELTALSRLLPADPFLHPQPHTLLYRPLQEP